MMPQILLLCFSILLPGITGKLSDSWDDPPFSSLQEGKIFIKEFNEDAQEQRVDMWEEISPQPYEAVQLNYRGTEPISIVAGDPSNDFVIEKNENDKWVVRVKSRRDYEIVAHRNPYLTVRVGQSESFGLFFQLVNILDNAPIFSADQAACEVEEKTSEVTTDCVYNVLHPDGFRINGIEDKYTNVINFHIPAEEQEYFELKEIVGAGDDYNKKYNLRVLKELDYTYKATYNFPTRVTDLNEAHSTSMNIVVQVQNIESRNPTFTRPFTTRRIPEKEPFQVTVTAIDGDIGLNRPICYKLQTTDSNHAQYFSIERETGILKVESIDRDSEQNEFYPFSITAYKCHNDSFFTTSEAAIILDDINDHWPEFEVEPTTLKLWENTLQSLDFELFDVNDPDLGVHATYTMVLSEKVNDIQQAASSFNIIPGSGYQKTAFTITIVDATQMDYELPERQHFQLLARATEFSEPTHTNLQVVQIELLNWNDEVPKFDKDVYEISIPETTGSNVPLVTVRVSDRDIGDHVQLTILSMIGTDLEVRELGTVESVNGDPTFGFEIRTNREDIFDWDVSREVIVQLQARDTLQTDKKEPLHTVFSQVVISVQDVNNKAPTIVLPRGRIHIEENSPPGTAVSNGNEDAIIIGIDPDSSAVLEFTIDWERSYATKEGIEVSSSVFKDCLTTKVDSTNRNRVVARIIVDESLDQETINKKLDYEAYETLFLTLKLEDVDQTIMPNTDEATLVIQLDDVNDNAPEFVGDTLTVPRFVLEEADENTIVGSIIARDIDGPLHNKIEYSISAIKPAQDGFIAIDQTGVLTVALNKGIGCDVPPEDYILLDVTIRDALFSKTEQIKISITDTNNKEPIFQSQVGIIKIFEKSGPLTEIAKLMVKDLDRDKDYYTVSFELDLRSDSSLQNFFEIIRQDDNPDDERLQTGLVRVKENNQLLDRDFGTALFNIMINAVDNPSGLRSDRRNRDEQQFQLVLQDINDQEPVLPERAVIVTDEDGKEGDALVERFEATDADDKDTPNAKINYQILGIKAVSGISPEAMDKVEAIRQLFALERTDDFVARLQIGHDLKGFYGDWAVTIEACDRGDEYELISDSPKHCNTRDYGIRIDPVNYMTPVINYPQNEDRIRLRSEPLIAGRPLVDTKGEQIANFVATDTDGGRFGEVSWTLESQEAAGTDHQIFQLISTVAKNEVQLVLSRVDVVPGKPYRVRVKAKDGGDREATPANVVITFIDMSGEPTFEQLEWATDFTENVNGTEEVRIVPSAKDPKVEEAEDSEDIYYFIDNTFGDHALFKLDKQSRELRVAQELDRESVAHHQIRIIATFNAVSPPVAPSATSILLVDIKVNDVNDNPPRFVVRSYSAGVTITDRGRNLFTVVAEDPDEIDSIRYSILEGSLEGHGDNLFTSPAPFAIHPDTGVLSLVVEIRRDMSGYYTFTLVAEDEVKHNDTVPAKIYLIADGNRVKFVFLNERSFVDTPEIRNTIKEIFTEAYELECNIDDVVQGTVESASRQEVDGTTHVRAHFIRNNEAVEALEIQQRSNDRLFVTNLKRTLLEKNLNLQDVPVNSIEEIAQKNELLEIVLIVVSSALAIVCIILLVAFCIKIRSLNRQLRALSANDFGSIASDLQKTDGRKVPTTNVFSVEGSNPVLNDQNFTKGAYDDVSVQSYESDFIGIDNDLFANNRKDDSLNPAFMDHIRQRSLNPLANGASTTGTKQPEEKPGIEPRIFLTRNDEEPSTSRNQDELTHRF